MAIQILPEKVTLGERLGTGLGSGLSQGLQVLAQQKMGQLAQRQQQAQTAQGLQALGIPQQQASQIAMLSPKMQSDVIKNFLAGAEERGLGQALSALGLGEERAAIGEAPTREEGRPQIIPGPQQDGLTPQERTFQEVLRRPRLSSKQQLEVAKLRQKEKLLERQMSAREKAEEKKISIAEQKDIDKETHDFYKDVLKKSKASRESEMRLGRIEELNEKGNLGFPAFNAALKALKKGVWGLGLDLTFLMSADAQEFDKLSTDFLKNVKDVFGARITDREVALFLQTIPSLSQSKSGRRKVIRNLRSFNKAADVRKKVMNEIVKENNGRRPRNLESLVDSRADKELDAIAAEFKSGPLGARERFEQFSG